MKPSATWRAACRSFSLAFLPRTQDGDVKMRSGRVGLTGGGSPSSPEALRSVPSTTENHLQAPRSHSVEAGRWELEGHPHTSTYIGSFQVSLGWRGPGRAGRAHTPASLPFLLRKLKGSTEHPTAFKTNVPRAPKSDGQGSSLGYEVSYLILSPESWLL